MTLELTKAQVDAIMWSLGVASAHAETKGAPEDFQRDLFEVANLIALQASHSEGA